MIVPLSTRAVTGLKRHPFLHLLALAVLFTVYDLRYGSGKERLARWWFGVEAATPDQVNQAGFAVASLAGILLLVAVLVARAKDRRSFKEFAARKASAPKLEDEAKAYRADQSFREEA